MENELNNTEEITRETAYLGDETGEIIHEPPIDQRALIKVKPLQDGIIKTQVENAKSALDYAQKRVIKNLDDVKVATDDLAMIAKLKKSAKAYLDDYTKPIKTHLDNIKADFDSIMKPLEEADSVTRTKILTYNRVQAELRQKQEEAERAARAAAEAEMEANGELSREIIDIENKAEVVVEAHANVGDLNTAKIWKFEVEDFAALPDAFKLPNEKMIRSAITSSKGKNIPPGVKAWQEPNLRITSR